MFLLGCTSQLAACLKQLAKGALCITCLSCQQAARLCASSASAHALTPHHWARHWACPDCCPLGRLPRPTASNRPSTDACKSRSSSNARACLQGSGRVCMIRHVHSQLTALPNRLFDGAGLGQEMPTCSPSLPSVGLALDIFLSLHTKKPARDTTPWLGTCAAAGQYCDERSDPNELFMQQVPRNITSPSCQNPHRRGC